MKNVKIRQKCYSFVSKFKDTKGLNYSLILGIDWCYQATQGYVYGGEWLR